MDHREHVAYTREDTLGVLRNYEGAISREIYDSLEALYDLPKPLPKNEAVKRAAMNLRERLNARFYRTVENDALLVACLTNPFSTLKQSDYEALIKENLDDFAEEYDPVPWVSANTRPISKRTTAKKSGPSAKKPTGKRPAARSKGARR